MEIDFRRALNTISDVVQNRPRPIREFDQIYMKVGDMVIQSDYIARKFNDLDVVFIGDGDSISLSIAHLKKEGVLEYGPKSIHLVDFDERIVNATKRFADKNDFADVVTAELYNVSDPLPENLVGSKEAFYTNPPWGASNGGASVVAFVGRGMEAVRKGGLGAIAIADDSTLPWTQEVIMNTQIAAIKRDFIVAEMIPEFHLYHLDDAPNLKSCSILIRHIGEDHPPRKSQRLDREQLQNFYGKHAPLRVKYVRDQSKLPDRNGAESGTYFLEEYTEI